MIPGRAVFAAVLIMTSALAVAAPKPAEWTVMVYMNGKNNLEPDAIENYLQMAKIGSTPAVHLLVEMGRPKEHYTSDFGPWSGVRRYYVKRDSTPTAEAAVMTLDGEKADMGRAANVAEFVAWAREKYPAKRTMLIIWNHGQGWRFQLAKDRALRMRAARHGNVPAPSRNIQRPPGGFRSISFDDDTGNFLYNRALQDALQSLRVDVLGFDACLMSMIEAAYAFRDRAAIMVASQELEPGAGWPYDKWLAGLVKKPKIGAQQAGKLIVDAYRERYGDTYRTTLTSLDLGKVDSIARELSAFSMSLKSALATEAAVLNEARKTVRPYGEQMDLETSIDLSLLLDRYAAKTTSTQLAASARRLRTSIAGAVVANYASKRMLGDYGSHGIAIYFPMTAASFSADVPDNEGYRLDNTNNPVEFVHDHSWSTLLHAYWAHF